MQLRLFYITVADSAWRKVWQKARFGEKIYLVIIFAFLSASLNNPQQILKDPVSSIVLSAEECVFVCV